MVEKFIVTRSVDLDAAPAEVWDLIGRFGALDRWHPLVATCVVEMIDEVEHRRFATLDGAEFLERLAARHPHAKRYDYGVVSSPLPLSGYASSLRVAARDLGARVVWSSQFDSDEPRVEAMVEAVYDAGLAALRERYGALTPALGA